MGRKRTPGEEARRELIRELLSNANVTGMEDIQRLFRETIAEFLAGSLDAAPVSYTHLIAGLNLFIVHLNAVVKVDVYAGKCQVRYFFIEVMSFLELLCQLFYALLCS